MSAGRSFSDPMSRPARIAAGIVLILSLVALLVFLQMVFAPQADAARMVSCTNHQFRSSGHGITVWGYYQEQWWTRDWWEFWKPERWVVNVFGRGTCA